MGPVLYSFAAHHMSDGTVVLSVDFDKMLRKLPPLTPQPQPQPQPLPLPLSIDFAKLLSELVAPLEHEFLLLRTPRPHPPKLPSAGEVTPTPSEQGDEEAAASRRPATPESGKKRIRHQHTLLTDAIILKLVDVHGPRWRQVSAAMGGRGQGWSDDVVRNRCLRIQCAIADADRKAKPANPAKSAKSAHWRWREAWSVSDDEALCAAIECSRRLHSHVSWKTVFAQAKLNRTPQAMRNRAARLGMYKIA